MTRQNWPRTLGAVAARVLAAALVIAFVRLIGGTLATDDALQVMGFDPDRARLIVALILGVIAATTVSLLDGGRVLASLTGLAAAAAWFSHTFVLETARVLGTSGTTGQFDPVGWFVTLISL